MSPKRYYTLMMDQELIDAVKAAKEKTGLSEGAIIRLALKDWLSAEGFEKTERKRAGTRKRS